MNLLISIISQNVLTPRTTCPVKERRLYTQNDDCVITASWSTVIDHIINHRSLILKWSISSIIDPEMIDRLVVRVSTDSHSLTRWVLSTDKTFQPTTSVANQVCTVCRLKLLCLSKPEAEYLSRLPVLSVTQWKRTTATDASSVELSRVNCCMTEWKIAFLNACHGSLKATERGAVRYAVHSTSY